MSQEGIDEIDKDKDEEDEKIYKQEKEKTRKKQKIAKKQEWVKGDFQTNVNIQLETKRLPSNTLSRKSEPFEVLELFFCLQVSQKPWSKTPLCMLRW